MNEEKVSKIQEQVEEIRNMLFILMKEVEYIKRVQEELKVYLDKENSGVRLYNKY